MVIKNPNILDKGLIKGFVYPWIRHIFALIRDANYRRFHFVWVASSDASKSDARQIKWAGDTIRYFDTESLCSNLGEIFVGRIYDFGDIASVPTIIDCGANIGLSQLYWKHRYGKINCLCFEPDPQIHALLSENTQNWGLSTQCEAKALSNYEGTTKFESDLTDAGRLTSTTQSSQPEVIVTKLSSYIKPMIKNDRVDLLKIDIEGEELNVLQDVQPYLYAVDRVFVEVHIYEDEVDILPEILALLKRSDYTVRIAAGVKTRDLWNRSKQGKGHLVQTLNVCASRGNPL